MSRHTMAEESKYIQELRAQIQEMHDDKEALRTELLPQQIDCPSCGVTIKVTPYIEADDVVLCPDDDCDVTYIIVEIVTYAVAAHFYITDDDHPPFSTFKPGTKESQDDPNYGEKGS